MFFLNMIIHLFFIFLISQHELASVKKYIIKLMIATGIFLCIFIEKRVTSLHKTFLKNDCKG